jgi:hypothetical protein
MTNAFVYTTACTSNPWIECMPARIQMHLSCVYEETSMTRRCRWMEWMYSYIHIYGDSCVYLAASTLTMSPRSSLNSSLASSSYSVARSLTTHHVHGTIVVLRVVVSRLPPGGSRPAITGPAPVGKEISEIHWVGGRGCIANGWCIKGIVTIISSLRVRVAGVRV